LFHFIIPSDADCTLYFPSEEIKLFISTLIQFLSVCVFWYFLFLFVLK
jgi:hypothetical protein